MWRVMAVIAITQAIKPQINIAPYFIGLIFLDSARLVISRILTETDGNLKGELNERDTQNGRQKPAKES
ncbi:hypothetical protein CCGE525_17535 [Rhizobium jaguaris]|uniref:Uncharacterized protein n=1 Tax=Rhizobium jaguaris TaxID=1312183 RepID=A0A387FX33_9HYPH|nr:hypothetical protein CCGE525_17535 [Rhizobium jaguaris]